MNLSFDIPISNPVNKEGVHQGNDDLKNILDGCQAKGLSKS